MSDLFALRPVALDLAAAHEFTQRNPFHVSGLRAAQRADVWALSRVLGDARTRAESQQEAYRALAVRELLQPGSTCATPQEWASMAWAAEATWREAHATCMELVDVMRATEARP